MFDVAQKPMLARLVRELPTGDVLYEPKWDGFRCLAYRDGAEVDLRSRHGRPLARYIPEIAAALRPALPAHAALDGELLVLVDGRFDVPALMARLHPAASRVRELAHRTPAVFVAFDVLGVGDEDLRGSSHCSATPLRRCSSRRRPPTGRSRRGGSRTSAAAAWTASSPSPATGATNLARARC